MVDLHMHTVFSDGKNSVEEMIKKSIELGLKKIAITDHIWKSSEWFDDYYNEIIRLKKKYSQIAILIGFEAKALSINGEIDANNEMCQKANIRLGAIHRIPKSNNLNEYFKKEEIIDNKREAYSQWFKTTKNMIRNCNVDIIAHPCMVLDKYNISIDKNDIFELFLLAKEYNKKLEISSRYKKSNIYLLEILKNNPFFYNCISYGSDAHNINDLQRIYYE